MAKQPEHPPVLHVLAPAPAGGLERVVRALARSQAARSQAVAVAAIVTPPMDEAALESLASPGVQLIPVAIGGRAYLRERKEIRSIARRCGACVAHTHGYRPDVVDASALQTLGVPVVTTVHGFTGGGWRNRLYERVQRLTFRRLDAVVAVSEAMARDLIGFGVPESRLHVIPNAYMATRALLTREAARAALHLDANAIVIGWVGRVSREKGLDVLLDAVGEVRDRPVVVSVIGDGRDRDRLRARSETRRLAPAIRWHGLVPEAASLYAAFDIFALSSRTEGTPIALFEAMDAEVPIVATAVGGVPAVVSPREAVLVPPDDPRAMADALRQVLADPSAARIRATAARQRLAASYSIEPWLARYDAVYARVLSAHQPRGAPSARSSAVS